MDAETQEAQDQAQAEQAQPEGQPEHEAPGSEEQPQEAVEAKDAAEETEPEADGEGEEGEEPQAQQGKPEERRSKPKTGFRRVISKLERQLAEKDALLAQALARLPQAQQQPGTASGQAPTPEQKAAEYIENLVDRRVEQRWQAQQQQQHSAQLQQKWEEQLPADEEEAYEVREWIGQVQRLNPGPVKDALLTSDIAPKIISTLMRDPRELARISALPEVQQTREILRLEAKLSASGGSPVPKPKSAARPPAPPSSVGGSSAKSTRNPEDLPISEYKRLMRSRGR